MGPRPEPPSSLEQNYEGLRRQAAALLARERPDHTLEPTALVHEAWLRLSKKLDSNKLPPHEVAALTGQVMRHILTDHARARTTSKREGIARSIPVDTLDAKSEPAATPIGPTAHSDPGARLVLAVDEALEDLQRVDAQLAQVVELRFFAHKTLDEIAQATALSIRTVTRRWQLARAWLLDHLGEDA